MNELRKSDINLYEERETFLAIDLLKEKKNPVMVDVGANIGLMSLNICHYRPDCTIYALEPGVFQYEILTRNINRNNLSKRIYPFNLAASDKKDVVEFHVHNPRDSSGDGFVDTGRAGSSKVVNVNSITLDEWWQDQGKPSVNILKIDTEGAELRVLNGSISLIKECKPAILIEICYLNYENYGSHFEDYINFFESSDYALFDLSGKNRITRSNYKLFQDQFFYLSIANDGCK